MSLRITEKTNSKLPSLYNNPFLQMAHSRSEVEEKSGLINEFSNDSFFYNDIQNISQISEVKNSNQDILNALKELKNSIDKLSDRVEKQNSQMSKIITAEEVQKRIEEKFNSVKELKRKSADSKCYIF